MNVEGNHIELIMRYINEVTDEAIGNIGATKLFDLMFIVIRYSSMKGDARKIMIDEMDVIDLDDYGDNKSSRYINYLKEMAIYNKDNE